MLELDTVKATYLGGSTNPALISPDAWNMLLPHPTTATWSPTPTRSVLRLPKQRHSISQWHGFLKKQQPRTIIFWGQGDPFFTPEGGEAYLQDLPKAEMHRLAAGHFAAEDCLGYIAEHIHTFYEKVVA